MTDFAEAADELRGQVEQALENSDFETALEAIESHEQTTDADRERATAIRVAYRQLESNEIEGVLTDGQLSAERNKLARRILQLSKRVASEPMELRSLPTWIVAAVGGGVLAIVIAYFLNRYLGHAIFAIGMGTATYGALWVLQRRNVSPQNIAGTGALSLGLFLVICMVLPPPREVIDEPPPTAVQTSDLAKQLRDISKWSMETSDNRDDFKEDVYGRWPKDEPRTRDFGELAIIEIESRPNSDGTWSFTAVPTNCEFSGGQKGSLKLRVPVELLPGGTDFDHSTYVANESMKYRRVRITCTITDFSWDWGFADGHLIGFATSFEPVGRKATPVRGVTART